MNPGSKLRCFHPYTAWECVEAGMYSTAPPTGISADDACGRYAEFLCDCRWFTQAMGRVAQRWPISCEHFLTNGGINRLAWLGQSSMCLETGVSANFCSGYMRLTPVKRYEADRCAEKFLRAWEHEHDIRKMSGVITTSTMGTAGSVRGRIRVYVGYWERRGYPQGIPEEVPVMLEQRNLAPAWKTIAKSVLENDFTLKRLGFTPRKSGAYHEIKKREIDCRRGQRHLVF